MNLDVANPDMAPPNRCKHSMTTSNVSKVIYIFGGERMIEVTSFPLRSPICHNHW